ncbi:hypothetical protein GEV33_003408 [Tenebrio molitor]|uniref:Uncharacterized protein n=1 Tax=Tenebrio molitor TaxID=7067 RepID=A0A8J6LHN8_TENMO|nr:hypothetical protein GEV33_003408 [Tenebrio molitor]
MVVTVVKNGFTTDYGSIGWPSNYNPERGIAPGELRNASENPNGINSDLSKGAVCRSQTRLGVSFRPESDTLQAVMQRYVTQTRVILLNMPSPGGGGRAVVSFLSFLGTITFLPRTANFL